MKEVKSEPKLKHTFSKYENYFTQKNLKEDIFMDDSAAEQPDLQHRMQTQASSLHKNRNRLALSLHDKVGMVLTDARKMAVIDKVPEQIKKSLIKMSSKSALPPLKKEGQNSELILSNIKKQLNDFSLKHLKTARDLDTIKVSTKQIREKISLIEEGLQNSEKTLESKIQAKKQQVVMNKYNTQILHNMVQRLKHELRFRHIKNAKITEKLNQLKGTLRQYSNQIQNVNANLNRSKLSLSVFSQRKAKQSEKLQLAVQNIRAEVADASKHVPVDPNSKLDDEYRFRIQANLSEHNKLIKQIRVQKALNAMMNTLYQKYQLQNMQSQKFYAIMKMHSDTSFDPNAQKTLPNLSMFKRITNSSTMTLSKASSVGEREPQLDLVYTYEQSFNIRQELEAKIREREQAIVGLEGRNKNLYTKWVNQTFINEASQDEERKKQIQGEVAQLCEREKAAKKHHYTLVEIENWLRKTSASLGLRLSKRTPMAQRLLEIIKAVNFLRDATAKK